MSCFNGNPTFVFANRKPCATKHEPRNKNLETYHPPKVTHINSCGTCFDIDISILEILKVLDLSNKNSCFIHVSTYYQFHVAVMFQHYINSMFQLCFNSIIPRFNILLVPKKHVMIPKGKFMFQWQIIKFFNNYHVSKHVYGNLIPCSWTQSNFDFHSQHL
jgi:hypothetical protein